MDESEVVELIKTLLKYRVGVIIVDSVSSNGDYSNNKGNMWIRTQKTWDVIFSACQANADLVYSYRDI